MKTELQNRQLTRRGFLQRGTIGATSAALLTSGLHGGKAVIAEDGSAEYHAA